MNEVVSRYEGKITSQGHRLNVTHHGDEVVIAFEHRGRYRDDYDPLVKVARVQWTAGGYRVDLFYLDAEEPTESFDCAGDRELYVKLDKAIETRSREVGPPEDAES
jgi:hypothetical protein